MDYLIEYLQCKTDLPVAEALVNIQEFLHQAEQLNISEEILYEMDLSNDAWEESCNVFRILLKKLFD